MPQQESSQPSKDEVNVWLWGWFLEKPATPQSFITHESYIDQGVIDSLGLIELIEDVEKRFGIVFSARDYQDRRFVTLDGLAEIINGRLQQR